MMLKHALAAALAMSAHLAGAQTVTSIPPPPVWPSQLGSAGSAFIAGASDTGRFVAWTYTNRAGQQRLAFVCGLYGYQIVHPATAGLTPIQTARAYWQANVTAPCDTDPRFSEVYAALMREVARQHQAAP